MPRAAVVCGLRPAAASRQRRGKANPTTEEEATGNAYRPQRGCQEWRAAARDDAEVVEEVVSAHSAAEFGHQAGSRDWLVEGARAGNTAQEARGGCGRGGLLPRSGKAEVDEERK